MGKHDCRDLGSGDLHPGRPNMPGMLHRRLSQLQVVEQLLGLGSVGAFHSHGGTPLAGWLRENPIETDDN